MRFMVMVKATKDSEAGVMPDAKLLGDMMRFNEELVKAGIMLAGEGLQPSSRGLRVEIGPKGERRFVDGPVPEAKELVAGYWLWKVKSRDELMDWLRRCPSPFPGQECELEVRQVFEAEDFGEEFTPEMREQEEKMRARLEKSA